MSILENYTTYVLVDPGGDITVTSAIQVDVATMRRDVDAYLYSDKGAGAFPGNLLHGLDASIAVSNADGEAVIWGVADMIGAYEDIHTSGNGLLLTSYYNTGVPRFYLSELVGGARYTTNIPGLSVGTTYYLLISRLGTAFTVNAYSDAGHTTLVGTKTLTLHSVVSYEYLYAVASMHDHAFQPAHVVTLTVQNLTRYPLGGGGGSPQLASRLLESLLL